MESKLKKAESLLRQALAIEMLEYEDKNLLSGNNCSRAENKMNMLKDALQIVEECKDGKN